MDRIREALWRARVWIVLPAMIVIGIFVLLYLTEPETIERIYPRF